MAKMIFIRCIENTARKNRIRNLILILVVLLIGTLSTACSGKKEGSDNENPYILAQPEKIAGFVNQLGYLPIIVSQNNTNYIDSSTIVYGIGAGEAKNSAILWVQEKKNNKKYYLLTYYKSQDNKINTCSNIVPLNSNLGEMKLVNDFNMLSDDDIFFLNDTGKKLEGGSIQGKSVLIYHDGIEDLLFCYDGEWAIRSRH